MSFLRFLYIGVAVVLLLGNASLLMAKSTGEIRGTISDPSGSVISNASAVLTETNTHISHKVASNGDGIFVFPDLPIGIYVLKITASGFATENRPALTLLTGQTIDLPIHLVIGSQSQVVTGNSETQSTETTTSTVERSITTEQIQTFP